MSEVVAVKARRFFAVFAAGMALVVLFLGAMYLEHRPRQGGRDLLTTDGSEGVESFQIRSDSGEVLWQIEASPARSLEHLYYGETPQGFRQVVPASGRPRPFRKGEGLQTIVMMPTRRFAHRGKALDESRFIGGMWESGPRRDKEMGT